MARRVYHLERRGLIAYLGPAGKGPTIIEYQACTHGGWAGYSCHLDGFIDKKEKAFGFFQEWSDVIDHAKAIVKNRRGDLEVL